MTEHKQKILRAHDLDQMASIELRGLLAKCKIEKMALDGKIHKGESGHSGLVRNTRKTIARIMTILVRRKERCVV